MAADTNNTHATQKIPIAAKTDIDIYRGLDEYFPSDILTFIAQNFGCYFGRLVA